MGGPVRTSKTAAALILVMVATIAAATSSVADARAVVGAKPCPDEATYPWMGGSVAKKIQIPSLSQPFGTTSYEGTILRPADQSTYPGGRPVVVLQHGNNGSQCRLWWAAQDLAGHGYIALVWTVPAASTQQNFIRSLDATRSALAFARAGANPYADVTDATRMAILGSSLGAIVTSYAQGEPDPAVKAAVAFDNLVPAVPSAPGDGLCGYFDETVLDVTPRVPALGFAHDSPCGDDPTPFGKQPAFNLWRSSGVPSMELVMRGFAHTDFMANGDETQRLDVSHYILAWFDRWLLDDPGAQDRLLAESVNGRPTSEVLSGQLKSAAHLPPDADTNDLVAWFGRDVIAPETKRVHGPRREIGRKQIRSHGLRFRFTASEPASMFECRMDDSAWRRCVSPRRLKALEPGRHNFRVRATDPAGNLDPSPARWRFRVLR